MENFKNKYEIILGFVTLIVSFSAFKDELSKINLQLGYTTISLSEYFLIVVCGFGVCLYFYIIDKIFQDTKIGSWKLFDYLIRFAYFIFVIILLTPIFLVVNVTFYKFYLYSSKSNQVEIWYEIALGLTTLINIIGAITFSMRLYRKEQQQQAEKLEEKEIKELDNANKLFEDGYYSHSVLETFKVLESHLLKKLKQKDVRVSPNRALDLINAALKYEIISQNDLPEIHQIREMRNATAHSDISFTKDRAEFALKFIKELLKRNQ